MKRFLTARMVVLVLWLAPVTGLDYRAQSNPSKMPDAPAKQQLIGHWKLASAQDVSDSGEARPSDMQSGRIMYDAVNNMAVQIMRAGGADQSSAPSGYVAYWGTYTVDENKRIVTHHIEGAANPNSIGRPAPHYYRLVNEGNRLILSPKENMTGLVTTWDRIH
jgi:hypothetical protein